MTFRIRKYWSLVAIVLTSLLMAQVPVIKQVKYQSEIGTLVTNFMALYHYEGMRIDDEISQRLFKNYFDALDYNRLFFLESDIQEFKAWENAFDEDLRTTPVNLDKAFKIYNRYAERVTERVKVVKSMLGKDFEFDKDEHYYINRNREPWAKNVTALNDIWRRRLKEEIIRFRLQGREKKDYLEVLNKRYDRLQKQIEEEEPEDVLERFLTAMTQAFDPHSTYFKPISKENFDIQMGHSLEGIGASLVREGEFTVVVDLLEGGPAIRSGKVHPDDKIVAVAQGDGEFEDVVDMRVNKVVKKIRGPKGTVVRLRMIPGDATDFSQVKEVSLIRDRVELTSLDEAIELTGLFIHEGPVVQVRDRQKQISVERDPDESIAYDGPLLVLTSVFSASASEIFSGAIQDYDRGIVVGAESTHGKGTVQQVISLETTLQRYLDKRFKKDIAGALKLTTHKFYRVSGGSTQFKGVIPDIVLPSPYDGMKVTEDQLDYALPWDEIRSSKHKDYDMVHEAIPILKTNSMKRVELENEFRYVREDTKEREDLLAKNFVTLDFAKREKEKEEREAREEARKDARRNRTTFIVETEDLKDQKEAEKKEDEPSKETELEEQRVPVPDFILEEALYVLRDFIQLKKGELIAGVVPKKDAL